MAAAIAHIAMRPGLRNTAGSAWYYVLYVFLLYYVLIRKIPRNLPTVQPAAPFAAVQRGGAAGGGAAAHVG